MRDAKKSKFILCLYGANQQQNKFKMSLFYKIKTNKAPGEIRTRDLLISCRVLRVTSQPLYQAEPQRRIV
jgi:hypothetical protein